MSEASTGSGRGSSRGGSTFKKSLYVTGGSLAGVGLGFAFQILLARSLGVSQAADVYTLGTMFPTLVATVFIGSSPSVIVPALHRQARASGVLNYRFLLWPTVAVICVSLATVAINIVVLPWLTSTLTAISTESLYTVTIISSLAMPLSWATAVGTSILMSQDRFLLVGASGAINGAALLIASYASLVMSSDVTGLAWAFVVGYVAQAAILSGVSVRAAWKSRGANQPHTAETITVALLALLVSALIYKSQPLIERSIASTFDGGPAAFNYASRLAQAVLMGSTLGLSMISLPSISRKVSEGAAAQGWEVATRVSTLITVFAAPLSITGILAATDVVRTIYGPSSFNPSEVDMIAGVLAISLVGVLFSSLTGPTVNYLYAIGFYKRVAAISVGTTFMGALVSLFGAQFIGLAGIAVGSSCAFVVNYAIYTLIARHHASGAWRNLFWRQFTIVITTLLAGWLTSQISYALTAQSYFDGILRLLLTGGVTVAAAFGMYMIVREKSANPIFGSG